MTDTVLQSFCERCGTRYTFAEPQEAKPEGGRSKLGRFGRRAPEPQGDSDGKPSVSTTLPSSDHFKGTFHFCLDCRQYTCVNCWNPAKGGCISCHPPGQQEHGSASNVSRNRLCLFLIDICNDHAHTGRSSRSGDTFTNT
jgi:hypothetical protein